MGKSRRVCLAFRNSSKEKPAGRQRRMIELDAPLLTSRLSCPPARFADP
jgi:hypothetical protein